MLEKIEQLEVLLPLDDEVSLEVPKPEPLSRVAYHGLTGKMLDHFESITEAHPAAIAATFLAKFGNAIGRSPHIAVGNSVHRANLYIDVVGYTGEGRKGTSYDVQSDYFKVLDQFWYTQRIRSGADSGEGLIAAVQDIKHPEGVDPADFLVEPERRLLLYESEFSSVFQSLKRTGNKLSEVLRKAWDGVPIAQLIKNTKETVIASEHHISGIFHITPEELDLVMDQNSIFNGLANRGIWIWSEKSKDIDDLLGLIPINENLAKQLVDAYEFAKVQGYMSFTEEYKQAWKQVRKSYLEPKNQRGMLGKILSRASVQVSRLALGYALLDKSPVVDLVHFKAALALWEYSRQSVKYIFQGRIEDSLSETIKDVILNSADPITRTDLVRSLGNKKPKREVDRSLDNLLSLGLIEKFQTKADGVVRPTTYFKGVFNHG